MSVIDPTAITVRRPPKLNQPAARTATTRPAATAGAGATAWRITCVIAGPLLLAVVVVAVWWIAVEATDTSIIVAPTPADVWHDFWSAPGTYLSAAGETLQTAMIGLLVGVAAGTLLAIAKWWSAILAGLTELPTLFFRALPFVALIPVASRLFGYGSRTALVITTIIAFFPSFALVDTGLRTVPAGSDDLLGVLGARKRQQLRRVALPASMPNAATALRLSATMTILGAMSSEYLTGSGGLGALYAASRVSYIHPARGWTIAVVAALMSFIAFALASCLERRAQARFASL